MYRLRLHGSIRRTSKRGGASQSGARCVSSVTLACRASATARQSRSWKSACSRRPPRGTRYVNMSRVIRHSALPFMRNRSASTSTALDRRIDSSQLQTSERDHARGSASNTHTHTHTASPTNSQSHLQSSATLYPIISPFYY